MRRKVAAILLLALSAGFTFAAAKQALQGGLTPWTFHSIVLIAELVGYPAIFLFAIYNFAKEIRL